MSRLDQLFEQFVRERRYLKNVTPATIEWYQPRGIDFAKRGSISPLNQVI